MKIIKINYLPNDQNTQKSYLNKKNKTAVSVIVFQHVIWRLYRYIQTHDFFYVTIYQLFTIKVYYTFTSRLFSKFINFVQWYIEYT